MHDGGSCHESLFFWPSDPRTGGVCGISRPDGTNSQPYYVCQAVEGTDAQACRQVPKQVYMREKFGDDRADKSECSVSELAVSPEGGSKVPRDRCRPWL